jgi:transposase
MQDPAALSKFQLLEQLAAQQREVARQNDIIQQLEAKLQQLQHDYLKLWQERFAARSERYIEDPDQLRIDFGDTEEAADAAEGLAEALEEANLIPAHERRKPRKKRDESLPAHLPRQEIVVDVPDEEKQCDTHGEKTLLPEAMWDVVERLKYIPPQLLVEASPEVSGTPGS